MANAGVAAANASASSEPPPPSPFLAEKAPAAHTGATPGLGHAPTARHDPGTLRAHAALEPVLAALVLLLGLAAFIARRRRVGPRALGARLLHWMWLPPLLLAKLPFGLARRIWAATMRRGDAHKKDEDEPVVVAPASDIEMTPTVGAPKLIGSSSDPPSLLSTAQLASVRRALPARSMLCDWALLYSTEQHGCSLRTCRTRLEAHAGPVVIVLLDGSAAAPPIPLPSPEHTQGRAAASWPILNLGRSRVRQGRGDLRSVRRRRMARGPPVLWQRRGIPLQGARHPRSTATRRDRCARPVHVAASRPVHVAASRRRAVHVAQVHPRAAVYRWTRANTHFVHVSSECLAFGSTSLGGRGTGSPPASPRDGVSLPASPRSARSGAGLYLDPSFEFGSSYTCATYGNECLASAAEFRCIKLEAWGFVAAC